MQGIKEEDARDENHLSKLEVSPITRANKSEKEGMNSDKKKHYGKLGR